MLNVTHSHILYPLAPFLLNGVLIPLFVFDPLPPKGGINPYILYKCPKNCKTSPPLGGLGGKISAKLQHF
jgi:hypothetical protein